MKAKIMDASHLLIILSEQEALRLGLNSISVDIPTTLSKITSFSKKKISNKETTGPYVYQFQNCTDMMDAAERLCMAGITCPKAKLLRFGGKYRIIFHLRWKTSKFAGDSPRIWHLKEKDALPPLLHGTRILLTEDYSALLQHLPLYKTLNIFSCLL
ncbi:MAG: hypothetical protein ACLR13_07040 [Acutalibacteraceae bacterium]